MKLEIRGGAVENLKQLGEKTQQRIRNKIVQLKDSPLGQNTFGANE